MITTNRYIVFNDFYTCIVNKNYLKAYYKLRDLVNLNTDEKYEGFLKIQGNLLKQIVMEKKLNYDFLDNLSYKHTDKDINKLLELIDYQFYDEAVKYLRQKKLVFRNKNYHIISELLKELEREEKSQKELDKILIETNTSYKKIINQSIKDSNYDLALVSASEKNKSNAYFSIYGMIIKCIRRIEGAKYETLKSIYHVYENKSSDFLHLKEAITFNDFYEAYITLDKLEKEINSTNFESIKLLLERIISLNQENLFYLNQNSKNITKKNMRKIKLSLEDKKALLEKVNVPLKKSETYLLEVLDTFLSIGLENDLTSYFNEVKEKDIDKSFRVGNYVNVRDILNKPGFFDDLDYVDKEVYEYILKLLNNRFESVSRDNPLKSSIEEKEEEKKKEKGFTYLVQNEFFKEAYNYLEEHLDEFSKEDLLIFKTVLTYGMVSLRKECIMLNKEYYEKLKESSEEAKKIYVKYKRACRKLRIVKSTKNS